MHARLSMEALRFKGLRCTHACWRVRARGYQYRAGFLDGVKREVITIYEIIRDAANNLLYAVPDYQYR